MEPVETVAAAAESGESPDEATVTAEPDHQDEGERMVPNPETPVPESDVAAPEGASAIPMPLVLAPEEHELFRELVDKGVEHLKARRYEEAIVELTKALEIDNEDFQVHRMLGNAYASARQSDKAIEAFQEAIRLNPDYPATHYELARHAFSVGKVELGAKEGRRILELDPDNPRAQELGGMVAYNEGDYDEAIRILKPFVERMKEVAYPEVYFLEAQYFLGVSYQKKGEFDLARQVLEEVALSSPYYNWSQEALRLMIMEERRRMRDSR